jgi:RNA polymerase sigma factor (sigma-70 family)
MNCLLGDDMHTTMRWTNPGAQLMETDTRTGSTLFGVLSDLSDPLAWEQFYRRYQPMMAQWCRRWGAQEADVEDVTHIVLCKLRTALEGFVYDRNKGRFRSWLKTVTRNTWINLRKESSRFIAAHDWDGACDDWEQTMEQVWRRELFEEAKSRVRARLEIGTWETFQLYALEGVPAQEVARRARKSVAAVYEVKYRVATLLKEELAELDGSVHDGEDST